LAGGPCWREDPQPHVRLCEDPPLLAGGPAPDYGVETISAE
jgi:hypothetical protein